MKYSNGDRTVIIPKHTEVAKGTLKSILSMADIPLEDFISKIWKKFPSPPASRKGSLGVYFKIQSTCSKVIISYTLWFVK